jgi:cytoskeleton protein RodZ
MIDIGTTLRDARKRQGLELPECELQTRIRARYLTALEEERFDQLPEPAYARGFLRSYATFLGIDARVLVEEFDDRMGGPPSGGEPPLPPSEPPLRRLPLPGAAVRKRGGMRHKGAIVWLVIGALGALLVALWIGAAYRDRPSTIVPPAATAPALTAPAAQAATAPTGSSGGQTATGMPQPALVLRMQGSPGTGSRVTVRAGTGTGKVLFSGEIPSGVVQDIGAQGNLWLTFDASTGVGLEVNGQPIEVPGGISRVVITPSGTVHAS